MRNWKQGFDCFEHLKQLLNTGIRNVNNFAYNGTCQNRFKISLSHESWNITSFFFLQSFLIAMMSLEDTESILHQVLSHRRYFFHHFHFIWLACKCCCLNIFYSIVIKPFKIFEQFVAFLFFLSFRTENPPTVNKTAVPPCIDELSKKVFEQAITGVLCKYLKGLGTIPNFWCLLSQKNK